MTRLDELAEINERQRRLRKAKRKVSASAPTAFGGKAATYPPERFRLKEVRGDYLICRRWDGEEEGEDDVEVAKPWRLRRTPFDVGGDYHAWNGLTFTFVTDTELVATDGEIEETWVVRPAYVVDAALPSEIWATKAGTGGTGVENEDPEPKAVTYLEDNQFGRAWSRLRTCG